MNKTKLIVCIVSLAVLLALLVTGITYAVWTTTATATEEIEIPVDDYNPSLKYLVFRGLTSEGAFTTDELAVSYAVVGYTGIVNEVYIPDTHNDLPVTRICIDPAQTDKAFAKNPNIISLSIPGNVTLITSGACQNMQLLETVTIAAGENDITIENGAFIGCARLSMFDSARTVNGDRSSYLYDTPLAE